MGCGGSKSAEELRSAEIEKEIRLARKKDEAITKLLLLGAGESGKSTLFKQMKILYTQDKGYSKAERTGYISVVHGNIIYNMQQLLKGAVDVSPPQNEELAEEVLNINGKSTPIDSKIAAMLKDIWVDAGVADSWRQRSFIQVQDALEYYMDDLDRISADDYEPSNQDILRTRVRTSGIVEETFTMNGTQIAMYDVGGQRSERRKWLHKFEDVNAIIYVTAISEYDQLVFEDNKTNRQEESLKLFKEVFNSKFFNYLNFILFFNKEDLFKEKLPIFPFRVADGPNARNVDFSGPYCVEGEASGTPGTPEFEDCVQAAEAYIQGLYQEVNNRPKPLYMHVTNATDTQNMERIMTAVKDMVLRENLQKTGFYVTGGTNENTIV